MTDTTKPSGVKRRGFASMDAAKLQEITSLGGKTAHQLGKAHKWNTETANAVGHMVGYADFPTAVLNTDRGQIHWGAHLCRPATHDETVAYWRARAEAAEARAPGVNVPLKGGTGCSTPTP